MQKVMFLDKAVEETNIGTWEVSIGPQTRSLVDRQKNLDPEEKNVVIGEAITLLEKCANPLGGKCSSTGIAIGYVQSGKTLSFTTLTALAKDNDYKLVIILAGTQNNLLEQTTNRLKKDLLTEDENSREYKIFSNPCLDKGDHKTISKALTLKNTPLIIITLLKQYLRIDELREMLNSSHIKNTLSQGSVLIIDDEADQASLNTMARRNSKSPDWEENEFSRTYASLNKLREVLFNHSYIQYTATPQGPLLINMLDLFSPDFHQILTPGKSYTGGKTFFIENEDLIHEIPENEVFHFKDNNLLSPPESLIKALRLYFLGAAIQVSILQNVKQVSMMVHADKEKDASKKFNGWIEDIIENWIEILSLSENEPSRKELTSYFNTEFKEIAKKDTFSNLTFEEVFEEVIEILKDTNIELVIEDKNNIPWSNSSSHILIGADKMNRGFTVEGLMVSYMPRYSKGKSNADTIQQRCRFFGYKKKYLDSCHVFLPASSILEYEQYIDHEEALRETLKVQSLKEYSRVMVLSSSMNPTRNNILSQKLVRNKMKKWRHFNPLYTPDENRILIEKYIEKYKSEFYDAKSVFNYSSDTVDRTHRIAKVPIKDMIQLISEFKVTNMPDVWRKSATLQYLVYWLENGIESGYIIQMGYLNQVGRERSLENKNGVLVINNVFSSYTQSKRDSYPGDDQIKFDETITIQIHLVKLKHSEENSPLNGRVINTFAIYYPEELQIDFVS